MKIKHLFTAAVLSVGLGASSASAALLDLTEVLSFNANSFNSSMIHLQNKGRMSSRNRVIAGVDSAITGGTFNTSNGDITFMGSVTANSGVMGFTATGSLFNSAKKRVNGLFGNIKFVFTSGNWKGKSLDFIFDDETYTTGGEPNGYVTGGAQNYIALWGETSTYRNKGGWYCRNNIGKCHGLDLRIAYEDNGGGGGGGVVPLPASFGFLLAGVGGFGFARKLRKKA